MKNKHHTINQIKFKDIVNLKELLCIGSIDRFLNGDRIFFEQADLVNKWLNNADTFLTIKTLEHKCIIKFDNEHCYYKYN